MKLQLGLNNKINRVFKSYLFKRCRDILWAKIDKSEIQTHTETPVIPLSDNELATYTQNLLKDEIKIEDERSRTIDGKLQGLLSLITISMGVISIIVGFLIKDFNDKKFSGINLLILVFELFFTIYITLQILRALAAIIKGLGTRHYSSFNDFELIPKKNEKLGFFQRRIIRDLFEILRANKSVNNCKADELNLAHFAINNGIWGTFIMVILLILTILLRLVF